MIVIGTVLFRLLRIPLFVAVILGMMWAALPVSGTVFIIATDNITDGIRWLLICAGIALLILALGAVGLWRQTARYNQFRQGIFDQLAIEQWQWEQARRMTIPQSSSGDSRIVEGSIIAEGTIEYEASACSGFTTLAIELPAASWPSVSSWRELP